MIAPFYDFYVRYVPIYMLPYVNISKELRTTAGRKLRKTLIPSVDYLVFVGYYPFRSYFYVCRRHWELGEVYLCTVHYNLQQAASHFFQFSSSFSQTKVGL